MSEHPQLDDLSAYLDGRGTPMERAALEMHLAACDRCSAQFDVLDRAARAVAELPAVSLEASEAAALRGAVLDRLEAGATKAPASPFGARSAPPQLPVAVPGHAAGMRKAPPRHGLSGGRWPSRLPGWAYAAGALAAAILLVGGFLLVRAGQSPPVTAAAPKEAPIAGLDFSSDTQVQAHANAQAAVRDAVGTLTASQAVQATISFLNTLEAHSTDAGAAGVSPPTFAGPAQNAALAPLGESVAAGSAITTTAGQEAGSAGGPAPVASAQGGLAQVAPAPSPSVSPAGTALLSCLQTVKGRIANASVAPVDAETITYHGTPAWLFSFVSAPASAGPGASLNQVQVWVASQSQCATLDHSTFVP